MGGVGVTHPLEKFLLPLGYLFLPFGIDLKTDILKEVGTDDGYVARIVCFEVIMPLASNT